MNLSTKPLIAGLLLGIMLCSCAYQSQVIHLNPESPKANSAAVPGVAEHAVVLITRDARSTAEIGLRSSGLHHDATITTDTDIAALLRAQMTDLLKAKGYRVVPAGAPGLLTLEVQLKELSYVVFTASDERKVKIQVLLEALITNGGKTFRKTFQAKQERRVVMEPIAKSNEEWINEAFSDTLKEVANDSQLFSNLE